MVREAKAGDVVASVIGARVPLILRRAGYVEGKELFSLVGTAYVHGFMDGQAEEEIKAGRANGMCVLLS